MPVQPIPEGYTAVTPYLTVHDAAAAIEFYKKAFGATELFRMSGPGGRIVHAEIAIDGARIMLGEECPVMGAKSPRSLGGTPFGLMLYVKDVDARYAQAIASGATEKRPLQNQFYGDRSGTVTDPFGHVWTLGTHIEDVSEEECRRRFEAMMKAQGAAA
jgi:PhnB protein